jgi:sterol 3beta-glucosyltransferase
MGTRAIWALTGWALRRYTDGPLNEVRKAAGLPAVRNVILDTGTRVDGTLLAVSPAVVKPDPLWAGQVDMTGFWFVDEDWQPSSELESFFRAGPQPVAITFGSMAGIDAAARVRLVADALAEAGLRGVLQAGGAQLGEGSSLPRHLFPLSGHVPHEWLFNRCAAVVHHGGAGTTAAALRAGRPQIIAWHLGDQPAWGALVHEHGVGPKPHFHKSLSPKRLAQRLKAAFEESTRARAADLGAKVNGERGAQAAVSAIERIAGRTRAGASAA